ncbi:hypothetical protein COV24_03365 [candidate division WWE3 bacterium CG10_big_fil_rev_8_21_14_0_10_32_10]|uniref:Uncharacterized protein n=1 Tax=candidate division WWE3 bacterium CG10_big_fil_rev_8_21_14_0_10_32_10 TaxID=1975090 RepID=A0A2H0R9R0_UNCKA|nr:MAG: hypothetical protein COV24_03365 [candidate division WWE3 bacterium CG10_big_fil_rev_8_21_14_0_10_32_10]
METQDLLVGNLAIASILIKTIISITKQFFFTNPRTWFITAILLGVLFSFIINTQLFSVTSESVYVRIFQNIASGIYVGASAMGIHEISKKVRDTNG